MKDLSKI